MEKELNPEVKEYLKQAYLFRGTTDVQFNFRRSGDFYYGCGNSRQGYSTSTSLNPVYAIFCGVGRCKDFESAKPMLLTIKPDNYLDSMREGLEFGTIGSEIEILGKIDFKDIVVVDSLDKFLEVYPNATPKGIRAFQENILERLGK